jgi:cytochrome c-type biogenesis protein CcmF
VYVSLGEKLEGAGKPAWAMRVYHKPFIVWIWAGCLLMALGGGMAALDKRYRKKVAAKFGLGTVEAAAA